MPLTSDAAVGRSVRLWRIVRRAGLAAGVALGATALLGLALYAGWPWLAEAAAARLAPALGLDALAVVSRRPGLGNLRLPRVHGRRGSLDVLAEDVRVAFGADALAAGRSDSVTVETLTLTLLDRPAGGTGSAVDELPPRPPRPAELLAALPADLARVETLVLVVPELGFRAAGRLELDDTGLVLDLAAEAPERARGLALRATLSREGLIGARIMEGTGANAAERVSLASRVRTVAGGAPRLGLQGRLDLRGMALELLDAAGLPEGLNRVRGDLDASLPWPVPRTLVWSALEGRGGLNVEGRLESAAWQVEGAGVDWRLGDGRLTGTVHLPVLVGADRWAVALAVDEWRLPDVDGAWGVAQGTATVRLSGPGTALLDAGWRADTAALVVDGTAELSEVVVEPLLRAFDVGAAAGSGAVRVDFEGRLDQPLADRALRIDGSLSGNWTLPAPGPGLRGIDGHWRLDGGVVSGDVQATATRRDLATKVGLTLAEATLAGGVETASGELAIGGTAPLAFRLVDGGDGSRLRLAGALEAGPALLGRAVTGWTPEADLTAGRIELDMDLGWPDPLAPGGRVLVGLYGVSAYYGEYIADGVSAELELRAEDAGWRLLPAPVTADRIATGVALRSVRSGIAWSGDVVHVQPTSFELLAGTAAVPAFDYQVAAGRAQFPLNLDGLDLARILALEGEQISGTGRIGGTLPVGLEGHRPSVSGGRIRAEPPGGRLRVSPTLAGGAGQPGLDFALRALQDFRYDVLEAGVDYDADGNLALAVHLEGRNPEIESGRPIHYNVNVTENLPVLLRSLRLEGEVTRSLERRLNN